ncbi:MAG: hypothetical protein M1457_09170, partial [bacterium]|nr:hypothetical protein [bacterium]
MTDLRRLLEHPLFMPLCLAGGVVARLAWVLLAPSEPFSDYWWYYLRALDMARGLGYVQDGRPTAFWPVGYPAFLGGVLWLAGPSPLAGKLANVALQTAALAGFWRIALLLARARAGGSPRAAAGLALAVLAFHPNAIVHASLLGSESLFVALLAGGVLMMLRGRSGPAWRDAGWDAACGIYFGLVCLVKPQTFFVPLVVAMTAPHARTEDR